MWETYYDNGKFVVMGEDDSIYHESDNTTLKNYRDGVDSSEDFLQNIYIKQVWSEMNILGCFAKDLSLMSRFDFGDMMTTRCFYVFYPILLKLYFMGYEKVTKCTSSIVAEEISFFDIYDKSYGYPTLRQFADVSEVSSFEDYLEQFKKYSTIRELSVHGFNVFDEYDELKHLNHIGIMDYFEEQLKNMKVFD